MAGAKMPNTENQLKRMAIEFKLQIQGQLRRKRKRVSIRAKWTKDGNTWKPTSVTKSTYTSNFKASGDLINSVQVEGQGMDWYVSMLPYAYYVINGRKKGKGIPVKTMQKWIKDKGISPRDSGTGKFKKMSKETLGFLMNRKIKYFGIDGFDFVEPARKDVLKRYSGALTKAIKKDIINII
jgi:hypothetical protein